MGSRKEGGIRFSTIISVPLYFHFLVINIYDRGTVVVFGWRRRRKFVFRNLKIVHVDPASKKGANVQVKERLYLLGIRLSFPSICCWSFCEKEEKTIPPPPPPKKKGEYFSILFTFLCFFFSSVLFGLPSIDTLDISRAFFRFPGGVAH